MTFKELQEIIRELKTDEEVRLFVNDRIKELESTSIEVTMGQEYTDTFDGYIGKKVHYKTGPRIGDEKAPFPDLVLDDYEPYYDIVKRLSRAKREYEIVEAFNNIYLALNDYFGLANNSSKPMERIVFRSYLFWAGGKNGLKAVSIRIVKKENLHVCSDIAGLCHNIFKILGVDSQLVIGKINEGNHAYNILFPYGYKTYPALIVDFANPLRLEIQGQECCSFPFYYVLDEEKYQQLLQGNPVVADATIATKFYKTIYSLDNSQAVEAIQKYRVGNDTYANDIKNNQVKKELINDKKEDTE